MISGTPLENGWEDLASLLYFLRAYPGNIEYRDIRALLRSTPGQFQTKQLLALICLRRPKSRICLPMRADELRTLDFEPTDAARYHRIKNDTHSFLQQRLNGFNGAVYSDVLTRINSLRQICNLGPYFQKDLKEQSVTDIRLGDAYELFDSMSSLGLAVCRQCGKNSTFVDPSDNSPSNIKRLPSSFEPHLTLCGQLLCEICAECLGANDSKQYLDCGHIPCCPWIPIKPLQPSMTPRSLTVRDLPVKMKAVQSDLRNTPNSDKRQTIPAQDHGSKLIHMFQYRLLILDKHPRYR